ncbi:hypothetical protein Hanom_Chr03g00187291 [Helianthus anomalus]
MRPPTRMISMYIDFFKEGNFSLPMTKCVGEVLQRYGIYTSQVSALGMSRITHYEF